MASAVLAGVSSNRYIMEMEQTTCGLCHADDYEIVVEGPDRLLGRPGKYRMVRCRRCRLLYQNPRPSRNSIAELYPDDYLPFAGAIQDEPSILRRWDRSYELNKRCRAVERHRKGHRPRSIVDVGCATGVFLDGMRRRGWETFGIEPSEGAANYARQRLGLNVVTADWEAASKTPNSVDVVTMWDVLEHLEDPRGALQNAALALKPGGLLVLSLPNPDTWELAFLGPYWTGWDLPRHLHLLTRDVLKRLLQESGFRLDEAISLGGRYHVLIWSLDLWLKERLGDSSLRQGIMGILRSWPARLAALPIYSVLDRFRLSSSVTYFCTFTGANSDRQA
jgi:SAM-dependent methyltransferase